MNYQKLDNKFKSGSINYGRENQNIPTPAEMGVLREGLYSEALAEAEKEKPKSNLPPIRDRLQITPEEAELMMERGITTLHTAQIVATLKTEMDAKQTRFNKDNHKVYTWRDVMNPDMVEYWEKKINQ